MEDLHSLWNHRWLTPKAKAKDSVIHGLGTVATKHIKRGETIAVIGGIVIPAHDIEKYQQKMGHVGIQIDEDFFICPTDRDELERTGVFNHSCDPNCSYENMIKLVACRDINPGEELTFDFACSETRFKPFKCRCGSTTCRKIIKPDDWKNPEIQKRLGKYFSPWLKKKI